MTLRIDRVVTRENLVVVSISGQIAGEHVDTLRVFLEKEENVGAIDLKEVLLVDREAVKVLAVSERNGIELRNCAAYIREWVARARLEMQAGQSE